MYPPVTSSTAAIKTQTFQRKGKVYYPTKALDYNQRPGEVAQGSTGNQKNQDNFSFRSGNNDPANNAWRTRSSGSNGSSSGTSSSPTVSSPLSRTSSVGSSNEERPGSDNARQAAVVFRNSPPPVYQARIEKNNHTFMAVKKSSGLLSTPAPKSSKNSANKPFNHKEVLEQMERAFREATVAIQAGHGKLYDAKEHGPAVDFTPFDWEEFWGQRKMKGM